MKNLKLIFLGLAVCFSAVGQKQTLSLEDAVMQQYRNLKPNSLTMFQWIPNTDCYSFVSKNYQ